MRRYPAPARPASNATSWNRKRNRTTQQQFRTALLQRDGHVCQRCGATNVPLHAHHDTPTHGRLLCVPCHRTVDPHAR